MVSMSDWASMQVEMKQIRREIEAIKRELSEIKKK
jgi:hypothetical protein